jgi:hypothetical protein
VATADGHQLWQMPDQQSTTAILRVDPDTKNTHIPTPAVPPFLSLSLVNLGFFELRRASDIRSSLAQFPEFDLCIPPWFLAVAS